MAKASSSKDNKDTKYVPLQRTLSGAIPATMLPKAMQGLRIAPAQSSLNTRPAAMVDGPPSPPSPSSPTNGSPVEKVLQKSVISAASIAKCDLSWLTQLDPKNADHVKIAEQAAAFLLGVSNGIAGDLKRIINGCLGTFLSNTNCNANNNFSHSLTSFASGTTCGWGINGSVSSGNNEYQRLGRIIKLKHCSIRFDVTWSQSTATANIQQYMEEWMLPFRIIAFRDKMTVGNGAATTQPLNGDPTQTLALTSAQSVLFNSNSTVQWNGLISAFNANTKGYRYEILHDSIVNPPSNAGTMYGYNVGGNTYGGMGARKAFTIHLPVDGIRCEFAGDGPTDLLIMNEIYVMFAIDTSTFAPLGANIPITPAVDIMQEVTFVDA